MKERTWKERRIENLEYFYGKAYEQFKSEDPHDDRRVYINTYEMIMEAVKSLKNEPNNYVAVAMNKAIAKDLTMLEDIGKRFGRTDYIFTHE